MNQIWNQEEIKSRLNLGNAYCHSVRMHLSLNYLLTYLLHGAGYYLKI